MKKLMNKKLNLFGKEISVFALVMVAMVTFASAALLPYFGLITGLVTVEQGLTVDGESWDTLIEYSESLTSLDAKMITSGHYLDNQADVDATVYLNTECTGGGDDCASVPISTDTIGLSTTWSTISDAFADASMAGDVVTLIADKFSSDDWSSSEARITILGSDVGVTTLNDLVNMSWDVGLGAGYAPHVDVFLDFDNDGLADDVLVFEHAKLSDADCDNKIIYPVGNYNTFDGKGIINDAAKAWLGSGLPGGCTTPKFVENWWTLSEWKAGNGPSGISGSTKVLRIEIEVDGWGQFPGTTGSSADISNIVVNGVSKTIETLSNPVIVGGNSGLAFYVNSDFPKMLVPGTYTITTVVDDTV